MLYGLGLSTFEQVAKIPLVRPERAGAWFKGISHKDLIELVYGVANEAGLVVRGQKFAVNKAGYDLAGACCLEPANVPTTAGDPKPWLAWTTSNSGKGRLRFYMGGCLASSVADEPFNMAYILKELCVKNKEKTHTINTDLKERVQAAVDAYMAGIPAIAQAATIARACDITDGYDALLLETARSKALPWSRLSVLDNLFMGTQKTLMDFMACYSYALRKGKVLSHIPCMLRLRPLLRAYGLHQTKAKATA